MTVNQHKVHPVNGRGKSPQWILKARNITAFHQEIPWYKRYSRENFLFHSTRKETEETRRLNNVSFDVYSGRVTLVVGTSDDEVDTLMKILGAKCHQKSFSGQLYGVCNSETFFVCDSCLPAVSDGSSWQNTNAMGAVLEPLLKELRRLSEMDSRVKHEQHVESANHPSAVPRTNSSSNDQRVADNNQDRHEAMPYVFSWDKNWVAYLESLDITLLSHLSIQETFQYHLRLLHPHLGQTASEHLIYALLGYLDLRPQAHTRIGRLEERVLSSGERCRVILGLYFLDFHRKCIALCDPFTQLDTFHAEMLSQLLHAYTRQENKSCILWLKQPTDMVLRYIDDVIILHGSRVIYSGDLETLINSIVLSWDLPLDALKINGLQYILKHLSSFHPSRLSWLHSLTSMHCLEEPYSVEPEIHPWYRHWLSSQREHGERFLMNVYQRLVLGYTIATHFIPVWCSCFFTSLPQVSLELTRQPTRIQHTQPHRVKHHIPFFNTIRVVLLRLWFNAVRNPYRTMPLLIITLQGFFFGFMFRTLKIYRAQTGIWDSGWPSHWDTSESSFLMHDIVRHWSEKDTQSLIELETALVKSMNITSPYTFYDILTNSSSRFMAYHVINCSYIHCALQKHYGPLPFTVDHRSAEWVHALDAFVKAARLFHATYAEKISVQLRNRTTLSPFKMSSLDLVSFVRPFFQLFYSCSTSDEMSEISVDNPLEEIHSLSIFPEKNATLMFSQSSMDPQALLSEISLFLIEHHMFTIPSHETTYTEIQNQTNVMLKEILGYPDIETLTTRLIFPVASEERLQDLRTKLFHCLLLFLKYPLQMYHLSRHRGLKSLTAFLRQMLSYAQYGYVDMFNTFLKRLVLSSYSNITVSSCLFSMISCISYQSLLSLFAFHEEKRIVQWEVGNGLYSSSTFFVAQQLADLPFQILSATLFSVPASLLSGFFVNPITGHLDSAFYRHVALCNLISFVFWGFSYLVSFLVHNVALSLIIAPYCIIFWLCFSGIVLLLPPSKGSLWFWIRYTSPYRYSYFVMLLNYLSFIKKYYNDAAFVVHWLSQILQSTKTSYCVVLLFFLGFFFRALSFLSLSFHPYSFLSH